MQVCPALDTAPHAAASAAASRFVSLPIRSASLPPHSAIIGVRFCAHAAITLRAVGLDPVNAILLTALSASASPVVSASVISCSIGFSGTISANELTSQSSTAGVYSLGLNTTALPAASA